MELNDEYLKKKFLRFWPSWVKVALLKWWIAGACYYFVGMGSSMGQGAIDIIFQIGLVMGCVGALMVYPLIKYFTNPGDNYSQFIFIRSKSPIRIILHVFYNWFLVTLVAYSYQGINLIINAVMHNEASVIRFPVDPIFFGLFYLLFDYLAIKASGKVRKKYG